MVSRGSSVHHTRRTNNPFMTTSSGIVGIDLREKVAFDAPHFSSSGDNQQTQRPVNQLAQFMYQTTTGELGEGVHAKERSKLSQRMDKLTLHKEVQSSGLVKVQPVHVAAPQDFSLRPKDVLPPAIDTRAISDARDEHPMYATSYREIGADKAQLKVEMDRLGRPNTFTASFNGFRYRDFGLNTAVTKSRICDQLDYS